VSNIFQRLGFILGFIPCLSVADQAIQYEPAVVALTGKVAYGKFQHPNGQWIRSSILKLNESVSVDHDGQNPINVREIHVTEIQLYADSKHLRRSLKAKTGKETTVEGIMFHSHTAWHIRPLVMAVSNVR
jgi:hypothetical protein